MMALAVLVRLPDLTGTFDEVRVLSFTDKNDLPFYSQHDAYYHLRMGDEIAEKGVFGEWDEKRGQRVDSLRFAPERMPAKYHDGIVRIAVWIWKVLSRFSDISLHEVSYYLSCVFAALTALAAFALAARISGKAGGIFAALFVSCAPAFAVRTAAGSYDTDMVQLLFTILMVLLLSQAVLAKSLMRAIASGAAMAAAVTAFSLCWSKSCLLFILIVFVGGGLGLVFLLMKTYFQRQRTQKSVFRYPGLYGYISSLVFSVLMLAVVNGPAYPGSLSAGISAALDRGAVFPDLLETVSELQQIDFFPKQFSQWLVGYKPGTHAVLNGTGGLLVLILAIAGLAGLFIRSAGIKAFADREADENAALLYLSMTAVWFGLCLYGLRVGYRFVEHFAAPTGILAGSAVGMGLDHFHKVLENRPKGHRAFVIPGLCCATAVYLCAAVFCVISARDGCRGLVPSSSDAQENAMDWIAAHAQSQDAVIASWWDMGYFYEYESGHPTLWDGGTQNGIRAILMGKILSGSDLDQSRILLQMIAATGNSAAKALGYELGFQKGFQALWDCSSGNREKAEKILRESYGIEAEKAVRIAELVYPGDTPEVYLVLTGRMLQQNGMFQYYADWDFSNGQLQTGSVETLTEEIEEIPNAAEIVPVETKEADLQNEQRENRMICRLFRDRDGTKAGEKVFESLYEVADGVERVQIWGIVRRDD